MTIEKFTAFRTSDGNLFTYEVEAERHQFDLNLRKWIEEEFGSYDTWYGDQIADKLINRRAELIRLLSTYP